MWELGLVFFEREGEAEGVRFHFLSSTTRFAQQQTRFFFFFFFFFFFAHCPLVNSSHGASLSSPRSPVGVYQRLKLVATNVFKHLASLGGERERERERRIRFSFIDTFFNSHSLLPLFLLRLVHHPLHSQRSAASPSRRSARRFWESSTIALTSSCSRLVVFFFSSRPMSFLPLNSQPRPLPFFSFQNKTNQQDIEKIAPKRGVVLQAVKEVLQGLVDEDLVHCERIGISNFFW